MEVGKLANTVDVHVVSATEAAYGTLFGLYLPQKKPMWVQASDWPAIIEEEWLVEHMDCHIYDSTGLNYQGRKIQLFAPSPSGQGPILLPMVGDCQYLGNRIVLARPVFVLYGVGVLIRTPVVVDTDQIQVSIRYRRVKHGRI